MVLSGLFDWLIGHLPTSDRRDPISRCEQIPMHDQALGRDIEAQENSDLQKGASDVCEKNTVLEAQNKAAHDKIQALEGELGALRTQNQTLVGQNQVYHGRVQALQSQYRIVKNTHPAEQSKRPEAQQQVRLLESSLRQAQKQTTTCVNRNKVLEERVKALESSNVALDAKVQNLIRGQDFRSTQETVGKPHQYFQNAIHEIQAMIKSEEHQEEPEQPRPDMPLRPISYASVVKKCQDHSVRRLPRR